MRIRYIRREEVMRFGAKVFTVEDEYGARLVREGKAVAIVDPASPPVSKETKKAVKQQAERKQQSTSGKKAFGQPIVGWLHDTEKLGGAELSNQTVIKVGRKLGFDIKEFYPSNFDKCQLARCDFFVLNNFFFFEPDQYHFIMDLIFEYNKPYIKYEHDHREIIGEQARPKIARLLFGRSFLNVFISPFQADNHRKYLGDLINPCWILPPAVDTSVFRLLPNIERDNKKVVNMCGKLYESKGFRHMLHFCLAKEKELKFEIYTKNHQEIRPIFADLKNVAIHPVLPNEYLPKIYNSAEYTIHLPHALEACGRSIAEGLLCGCKPILNRNVGIISFKKFMIGNKEKFNLDRFRQAIEIGPHRFWKEAELYYKGIKNI